MICYVPSSAAEPLSYALYALSRPPQVRGLNDTTHLFGWHDDPHGGRWLIVDTEYEIPVHPDAVLGGIADILEPWFAQGLPADTNDVLAAHVLAKRGQRMVPWEAFPQFFKDLSKTPQEMIDAGLLAVPETSEP